MHLSVQLTGGLAPAPIVPLSFGVPVDFILFALTLLGIALFHHAVGFGGSMIWFGSSAGVALCTLWVRHGWFIIPA